jgi:hypothetical protein
LAAIDEDGCPFCCAFSCQSIPTPTPIFDPEGRQVFVRQTGQFLFVIEGARGSSNRDPGENLVTAGSERPDAQVLFSRDIGDGSVTVCDNGPPPNPFGGVPGIDPPLFGPGADVTAALQDVACRFSIQRTSAEACTRDRFGQFSFLGTATRKQFCFAVPVTAAFPEGETVIAVQLVDTLGNLGPKREIVLRVE